MEVVCIDSMDLVGTLQVRNFIFICSRTVEERGHVIFENIKL